MPPRHPVSRSRLRRDYANAGPSLLVGGDAISLRSTFVARRRVPILGGGDVGASVATARDTGTPTYVSSPRLPLAPGDRGNASGSSAAATTRGIRIRTRCRYRRSSPRRACRPGPRREAEVAALSICGRETRPVLGSGSGPRRALALTPSRLPNSTTSRRLTRRCQTLHCTLPTAFAGN